MTEPSMRCIHGKIAHECPLCMNEKQPPRDPLLVEREKTHGSFAANAAIFKKLCDTIPYGCMPDDRRFMALCMILVKLSRVVQTPNVKDHWDDIAGYAKLGSEACE